MKALFNTNNMSHFKLDPSKFLAEYYLVIFLAKIVENFCANLKVYLNKKWRVFKRAPVEMLRQSLMFQPCDGNVLLGMSQFTNNRLRSNVKSEILQYFGHKNLLGTIRLKAWMDQV